MNINEIVVAPKEILMYESIYLFICASTINYNSVRVRVCV